MTKHDFMSTWNRSCYAQFACAVRNWLNRSAFEYEILSTIKTKRLVFFLFLLCIIGVCSLKKITSWIQGTSSRQRMFGKMDFWISHQGIAFIFCFVLKVGATESKFMFFSLAFVMVSVCCVSKFPSSETIRKWQTDFSPDEATRRVSAVQANHAEKSRASGFIYWGKSRFISNKEQSH